MEGKRIGGCAVIFFRTEMRNIMENIIYIGASAVRQAAMRNKKENKSEEPKSFKEQIAEMAKYKSPKEMTLQEYRQYLREKINRTILPFCGDHLDLSLIHI